MKSTPCNGEKNLAPLVSPLVTFWRANYVWPTYGPNGLAMTWPMQVLRRPFVGGLRGKPRQYLLLTCQHKNYLRWEKDLDKGRVYHSGLLLYTSRKAGFACWPQNWTKPSKPSINGKRLDVGSEKQKALILDDFGIGFWLGLGFLGQHLLISQSLESECSNAR